LKLIRARVMNYRSVEDSEEFDIGELTCLVGKNEAGKTTLLNALRGLNPAQKFTFDKIFDYPRRYAARFDEKHPDGTATVIESLWKLEEAEIEAIADRFGPAALSHSEVLILAGYGDAGRKRWTVDLEQLACLAHLADKHGLSEDERAPLAGVKTGVAADESLAALPFRTEAQELLLQDIKQCRKSSFALEALDILNEYLPKFFYASHFERMSGEISIEQLQTDRNSDSVKPGDQIFLDFLAYAGTTPEQLIAADRREALKAQCEAAGNEITDEIFQFWTQNAALEVQIDFASARPADPPPFNAGTVAQIRIRNTHHKASLPLTERSAGFVWFFSFLAQFKQLKKTYPNAIILLDEPGLTLHGRAQADLLRYIVERLLPEHQIIYTTHSPFMVPMNRIQDVRIVEDAMGGTLQRPVVLGTKVHSDVLLVSDDTLFPLQGALGYEVSQSLFIAPNTWLVEGPSDILYLQVLSQALIKRRREGMAPGWAVCPSGGIDKIAPFVRLFGGNRINIAVLSDVGKGDHKKIDALKRADILKAGHFLTVADFVDQEEADIEDLFAPELFAELLNSTYNPPAKSRITAKRLGEANKDTHRVVKQAEALFRVMPSEVAEFDHFAPSRWLLENPIFLDRDSADVSLTLDRAEKVFKAFNAMLA
jgi:energy-coupling factor transporter ATP-binding protein EcfA2